MYYQKFDQIFGYQILLSKTNKVLDLERTWFGSEVRLVFLGSVGSRFGFWGQKGGSGGSRFGFKVRRTFRTFLNQENCLILTEFSVKV